MKNREKIKQDEGQAPPPGALPGQRTHGRLFSTPAQDKCLDAIQLNRLERSYREWAEAASRSDVRMARQRILLIFLLLRYTGAKLSEVLRLYPIQDIDVDIDKKTVSFGRMRDESMRPRRTVQLSEALCQAA